MQGTPFDSDSEDETYICPDNVDSDSSDSVCSPDDDDDSDDPK